MANPSIEPYGWASVAPAGKARGSRKGRGSGYYGAGKASVHVVGVKPWERQFLGRPGTRGHARMLKRLSALQEKGGLISS